MPNLELRDPLSGVQDAPLFIVPRVLDALRAYRAAPHVDPLLGELLERLLAGIERHPTKFFVMKQFQQTLIAVETEDTQAREHVGMALEEIMEILGIASSDGVLGFYLGRLGGVRTPPYDR